MTAPVLAVGDGALGFWKAVREVFPATREQRCWFHKQANVLAALPKSAHPGALAAIREIYNAEDIDKAQVAIKAFEIDYGAKYPKAVAKIVDDADVLLEFYKYPAEHWIHLRTTNPIECTFATVRLRTKVTKGPGSRAAGIAMAYKLIDAAQARWRAVNAPHLVALVRAGAVFHKGKLLERPTDITPAEPTAINAERRSPETPRSTGLDNSSPQPQPLPLALTAAQPRTPPTRQCICITKSPIIVRGQEKVPGGGNYAPVRRRNRQPGQGLPFESSCNRTTFDLCSYATKRYARRALLIVRHFCTPSARAIKGSWAKTPVNCVHTRE